eukprot:m.207692 g.207692  ORF g.207692 m.207692 type:complete len:436 (-) comp22059_c0_seq2:85-1392(-)
MTRTMCTAVRPFTQCALGYCGGARASCRKVCTTGGAFCCAHVCSKSPLWTLLARQLGKIAAEKTLQTRHIGVLHNLRGCHRGLATGEGGAAVQRHGLRKWRKYRVAENLVAAHASNLSELHSLCIEIQLQQIIRIAEACHSLLRATRQARSHNHFGRTHQRNHAAPKYIRRHHIDSRLGVFGPFECVAVEHPSFRHRNSLPLNVSDNSAVHDHVLLVGCVHCRTHARWPCAVRSCAVDFRPHMTLEVEAIHFVGGLGDAEIEVDVQWDFQEASKHKNVSGCGVHHRQELLSHSVIEREIGPALICRVERPELIADVLSGGSKATINVYHFSSTANSVLCPLWRCRGGGHSGIPVISRHVEIPEVTSGVDLVGLKPVNEIQIVVGKGSRDGVERRRSHQKIHLKPHCARDFGHILKHMRHGSCVQERVDTLQLEHT